MLPHFLSKLLLVLCPIILAATGPLSAQGLPDPNDFQTVLHEYAPTPKALSMIRYGCLPVDLNSGTMSMEIPIGEYRDQDFSIPISLRYSSSGFKPASPSGEAGLGWSLAAGGAITREIVGVDDFGNWGYATDRHSLPDTVYQLRRPVVYSNGVPQIDQNSNRETTSDLYHFSFFGHSGSFVIDYEGNFTAYGTSGEMGTYDIQYSSSGLGSFTIKTSDGTTWCFGKSDISRECMLRRNGILDKEAVGLDFAKGELPTVTWLLDRIIAPDGRVAEFTYSGEHTFSSIPLNNANDDVITTFSRGLNRQGDTTRFKFASLVATVYLQNIKIKESVSATTSKTVASFNWEWKNYREIDETVPANDYTKMIVRTRRLQSVSLSEGSTPLRTATLSYDDTRRRPLLTSVVIPPCGTWTMEYYLPSGTSPFPGQLSNAVDMWGYYNGQTTNPDDLIVPTSINSSYDEYLSTDKMDPDAAYSVQGMLRKVTLPTGGSTTISYESNQASKIVFRRRMPTASDIPFPQRNGRASSAPFTSSVENYDAILHSMDCGGVRVARIEEDNLTDSISVRSFSYTDSTGISSGIVQEFNRYFARRIGNSNEYNPYLRYPNNGFTRRHIAYTSVVETFSDNTSERTDFSSWLDEPDEFSPYNQFYLSLPEGSTDAHRWFMNNILREGDSREYRRGLPLKKTLYDENGSVLRREEYTYTDLGAGRFSAYVVGSGEYWWSARRFLADRVLSSTRTTVYPDAVHGVTSSRSLSYDEAGRIISSSVTDSDGTVRTARTSYLSYPLQPSLISSVVNTVRRTDFLSAVRTDSTRFSYSQSGNLWNMTRIERYVFNRLGAAELRDNILYASHDANGHARQMTVNGDVATFVWGYGGRYPVALVRNCALNELPTALQQTLSGSLSTAQVKALFEMTGKEVRAFKYNPSIGVIRELGPSGRSVSYLYDGYARLVQEKDAAGTLLRRYIYGCEAWDGNTQLRYLESQTSTGAGTRAERTLYDGLGREWLLSIRKSGTVNPTHKVTLLESDGLDRRTRTYLPFAAADVPASSAYADQTSYWNNLYAGEGNAAYMENTYSGGPMALTATETLPGQAMRTAGKHTSWDRSVNGASEVPKLVFNESDGSITVSGYYPSGTLIREETTAPDGETTVTFTTSEGAQVLARTVSGNERLDTYTVQDGHDRTAWVVGPGLGESIRAAAAGSPMTIASGSSAANAHCFVYEYGYRGDLYRLRRPGAGVEEFGHDAAHRQTTDSPAALRQGSTWAFVRTEYDALGRETGTKLRLSRVSPIPSFDRSTEGTQSLRSVERTLHVLTEQTYGQSTSVDCITGETPGTPYAFLPGILAFDSRPGILSEPDPHVTGELIQKNQYPLSGPVVPLGHIVELSGWEAEGMVGDDPAKTAYYYDGKGRVIQQVTLWPDGGLTRLSRAYDLEGNVLRELEEHRSCGAALSGTDWLWSDYTYDTRGNLLSTTTRCGRGALPSEEDARVSFSGQFTYDGIDRRTGRSITSSGHTLSVGEGSTLQGWRSSCAYQLDSQPVFSESLKYWDPNHAAVSGRYGGQISEAESLHAGYPSRVEGFAYDGFGRLSGTMAWLGGGSTAGTVNIEDGITYDALGGILSLSRKGPDGMAVSRLGMTRSGGRVTSVRDSTTNQTWNYQYASDGTLKKDTRVGLEYADNLLGLMAQEGTRRGHSLDYEIAASYSYLPDGTKLDVTKSDSSAVLYRGRFTYRRSASGEIILESIAAPEGVVITSASGMTWTPYTLVTDRLGSVRAIVDMSSGTVVERNDYYPYGKRITTPSSAAGTYPQLATNRWRFSGKEEQDSLAFTPYLDFGARQYDPEIATWLAPDPLATDYPGLSPYVYCAGDPVNLVDPEGREFRRKWTKNTIVISSTFYTNRHSEQSARIAAGFWNKRKNDSYEKNGRKYSIEYKVSVIVTDALDKYFGENTYEVVTSKQMINANGQEDSGQTRDKQNVIVSDKYAVFKPGTKEISTTGAHEIGHAFGISDHTDETLMSQYQDEHRSESLLPEQINIIVESDLGKDDYWHRMLNWLSHIMK